MRRAATRLCLVAAMCLISVGARATGIELSVPDADKAETRTIAYDCDGDALSVDYVNAGPVSLAIFAIDGTTIVASNVLSGSGARYAGSHYIWWSKGREASLYDLMQDENAPPIHCIEAP